MKIRVSPAQRNTLRTVGVNKRIDDSLLTEFKRKPYRALKRKGLLLLETDKKGNKFWVLSGLF